MADEEERAFVKRFVHHIANHPVTFSDDYQQPLQDWAKKPTPLPVRTIMISAHHPPLIAHAVT